MLAALKHAAICLTYFLFVKIGVLETKVKSPEGIELQLAKKKESLP